MLHLRARALGIIVVPYFVLSYASGVNFGTSLVAITLAKANPDIIRYSQALGGARFEHHGHCHIGQHLTPE